MSAAGAFHDHFSGHAELYARARPTYPAGLFDWLASGLDRRERACDCGTGSGQAALALVERFEIVFATDASPAQLAHAAPHRRIRYAAGLAEAVPLAGSSMDLVVAAQALHWFEPAAFFAEARRLLRSGGRVAVWGYGRPAVAGAAGRILERFHELVAPFWPAPRALLDRGYATVPFPFEEEPRVPGFTITHDWEAHRMLAYLRTWSATRRLMAELGRDPVDEVADELREAWGAGEKIVRWPLFLRAGTA